MPPNVRRCLDPTRAGLRALLDDACAGLPRPGAGWGAVLTAIAQRPRGVVARRFHGGQAAAIVCWWRDALGRRHGYAQVGRRADVPAVTDSVGPDDTCLLDDRHPLEWIAPPLASGWRGRGPYRDFIVLCRCGNAGTPPSLAWMGQTCGPCFDREQEGIPPAGPEVCRGNVGGATRVLLAGGDLVALNAAGGGEVRLCVFHPPWDGPPRWQRSWAGHPPAFAAGPRLIACADPGGHVRLFDRADGSPRPGFSAPAPLYDAAFASGGLFVTLHRDRLSGWDVAGVPRLRYEQPFRPPREGGRLWADGNGRVLVRLDAGFEVRDADTGAAIDRLDLHAGANGAAAWTPGGAVVAGYSPGTVARWGPFAPGRPARRAARSAHVPVTNPVPLVPDNRAVLVVGDRRVIRLDPDTMSEQAWFAPSLARLGDAACDGGQLIVNSDGGVAAWPWRELLA